VTLSDVTFFARDHCIIRLRPGRLARLFGAKDLVVELEWNGCEWRGYYSRESICSMDFGYLIRRALSMQPVESPRVVTPEERREQWKLLAGGSDE
jgi:hypothetical protein